MPIGRFARLCRLSVKQLRLYDDLGGVRPRAGPGRRRQLFLRLPDQVESAWVDEARETARIATGIPAVSRVHLVGFAEGRCVQALHRGPYTNEHVTLAAIDSSMDAARLVPNGLHHDIYLTDIRVTDAAAARTILRQPVRAG